MGAVTSWLRRDYLPLRGGAVRLRIPRHSLIYFGMPRFRMPKRPGDTRDQGASGEVMLVGERTGAAAVPFANA